MFHKKTGGKCGDGSAGPGRNDLDGQNKGALDYIIQVEDVHKSYVMGKEAVPADKGFIDAYRQALWAERHIRKLVETVGSHLTERFAVARLRVHDLWHFQHRLIRKVLAHTIGVFLSLQLGRPPLDLDGLISV